MQIAIELPNDFVNFQSVADIEKDMPLSYALWLFKNTRVTTNPDWFCKPVRNVLLSYA
jgi:hypothetical protein